MNEIQPISTEGMPSEIMDGAAMEQMESLETIVTDQPAEAPAEEAAPAKEPGWIKGRIEKAVSKAEARIREEYEAKLAPLYESIYDRQAEELVSAGEFKSLDTAKEYVRMKNGVVKTEAPQAQTKTEPARDENGRFTQAQKADPVAQAQADLLFKQAQKIKTTRGVDVMDLFNSDANVRTRVLSGEWDFYDVADAAMSGKESTPPAIVRSANGGAPSGFDISRMTDEQFKRLQQNLREGHRYDLTK